MTKKDEKAINDFCVTAKLLGMSRKEVEERLVNTTVVKRSRWDEVCEIIDGYFKYRKLAIASYMIDDPIKRAEKWIEEQKQTKLLLEQKDNKIETQHKLIDTMTESYDGTYIRMVSHDYINKACKQTNQSQSELYNKVYKLVGRSLKIDLDVQLKNFSNKERQIVKSNMEYNRENNLKGMDRKTPCFIKDSKAEISKLEFICNVLGRGIVVLESIAKVCEVGISEVVSKYNIIKETAKIKGDDYNV